MCGVIGFYSKSPSKKHVEALQRLFKASKIRGLHAFGYTFQNPGKKSTRTLKFSSAEECIASLELLKSDPPSMLIGHNRYSTSGDYKDPDNNQPITIPGISLVFNGVITQASKEEYEKVHHQVYTTENDGEIFARKVLNDEDWYNFVAKGRFSFAGVWIHRGQITMMRNKNRPLWCSPTDDAIFVASTEDIFERATGFNRPHEVPVNQPIDLPSAIELL